MTQPSQPIPTAPATPGAPPSDPVLGIMATIATLSREHDLLDRESLRRHALWKKRAKQFRIAPRGGMTPEMRRDMGIEQIDEHMSALREAMYALDSAVAFTPATTIEGAIVQLAVAAQQMQYVDIEASDNVDETRRLASRAWRLIWSAIETIEARTGRARPSELRETYLVEHINPVAIERAGRDGCAAPRSGETPVG